jgi:alkaline phosphatase D
MTIIDRRQFLAAASAVGVFAAWAGLSPGRSRIAAQERRDLYPEGIASGTRQPYSSGPQARLRVEVSEDVAFNRLVASANAKVLAVLFPAYCGN